MKECHKLIFVAGILAATFCGTYTPKLAAAVPGEIEHSWHTFEADISALGGAGIRSRGNDYRSPSGDDLGRSAKYRVDLPAPGTYDLYMRAMAGDVRFNLYFSRVFGDSPQWVEIKGLEAPKGGYVWVNLSEKSSRKPNANRLEASETGAQTFMIATRTTGTLIDAFALGRAGETFTEAQLNAVVLNPAVGRAAGLVGFQAEAAYAFGEDILTPEGQKLQMEYASRLDELARHIRANLPPVSEAGGAELLAKLQDELKPTQALAGLEKRLRQFRRAEDSLLAVQEKIRVAPVELRNAEERLQEALRLPDGHKDKAIAIETAQKQIEGWKNNINKRLPRDLRRKEKFFQKAQEERADVLRQLDEAFEVSQSFKADTRKVLDSLGVNETLSSSALDAALAKFIIISEATPRALARYAAASPQNLKNVQELFANPALMVEMLYAGGAKGGYYGRALEIFNNIQATCSQANKGHMRRLALAVALAHARPVKARAFKEGDDDAEQVDFVDPVRRYMFYRHSYFNGDLDPAFNDLNTWELTMVVDSQQADEALYWGREMMRSYRPKLMNLPYVERRYAKIVDEEIQYSSQHVSEDRDDLRFMQNILANGGICGRRAFFGRFVLKAFGIPTVARPEPGHATLAYYTPSDGWQAYLGGNFGNRARIEPYGRDMHFLLNTLARENETGFMKVLRAQWIGKVSGEPAVYGIYGGEIPEFWHAVAIAEQDRVADLASNKTKLSVAENSEKPPTDAVLSAEDRKITTDPNGVITIPAAAATIIGENRAVPGWGPMNIISFSESRLGGKQLHYSRYGGSQVLEYTFQAPRAGPYALSSKICTTRWAMGLQASVNGGQEVNMPLPFTLALWGDSEPVVVNLRAGTNTLKIARSPDLRKGIAIHHFTLKPL
jgi:hypothetical protein